MKPTSFISGFIIFSILIVLPLSLQAKKVSVDQNCKRISNANITQETCLAYFKADPGSKNTNLHTLGLIAFKRTIQNATDVQTVIQGHIWPEDSDTTRVTNSAMKHCQTQYNKSVEAAREALKKYEAKEYKDSATLARQLDSAPTECENKCKSVQMQSPLGPDNAGFRLNILISSRIADMLAAKKSKKSGQTTSPPTDPMTEALKDLPPQMSKEEGRCYTLLTASWSPKMPREFCIELFTHDPTSKAAGSKDELATILFKMTINNATGMLPIIDNHLKSASGAVKSSLEECVDSYSLGLSNAKRGLELYEKKEYKLSRDETEKVANAATNCEDTFTEQKVQSPLTKENETFKRLGLLLTSAVDNVIDIESADEREKTVDQRGPDE